MTDPFDLPEPRDLWRYFLALSRIPRPSGREEAAARWVAEEARALGCEVERDGVGNVLVRKPAAPGRADRPGVALQAHLDMVCEKNGGTVHDFDRDPIRVVRDGDAIRAVGTTLGADDGIGVAAAMAVLASRELRHGPLEALFTVDEETGLTGASALRPGWLRARYLLNLDSEEEGELTIGCAGGLDTVATRRLALSAPPPGARALRVEVTGLRGGHSGTDIGAGRGNSLRVLAQLLDAVLARLPVRLAALEGGAKRNAIPREASAVLLVSPADEPRLATLVAAEEAAGRTALGAFDPGLAIRLHPAAAEAVLSPEDARALVGLLLAAPTGIEAMSPDIPGLVQTSTNMGVASTRGGVAEVTFLTRSSVEPSRAALAARVAAVARLAGFEPRHDAGYPGWKPEPGASLVGLVDGVHRATFGRPMVVKAIHAGLECGLIGEKHPGLEMVSLGPTVLDAHTPDERVGAASVAAFARLLGAVLEAA